MEIKFSINNQVGSIVAEFPKAAEIFKRYRIDFCCGGDRPLADVIREQGLNESAVMAELNQAYSEFQAKQDQDIDWRQAGYGDLVDHIVSVHHRYLDRELPAISELVTKILRVHGAHHSELAKVHRLFHQLKLELEQHLITEEEVLFPLIKEYDRNPSPALLERIQNHINDIENEHEQAGTILKELRNITAQYAVPADACPTYRLTYDKLVEMESDIFQHIHLENNILHPRLALHAKCGCH